MFLFDLNIALYEKYDKLVGIYEDRYGAFVLFDTLGITPMVLEFFVNNIYLKGLKMGEILGKLLVNILASDHYRVLYFLDIALLKLRKKTWRIYVPLFKALF